MSLALLVYTSTYILSSVVYNLGGSKSHEDHSHTINLCCVIFTAIESVMDRGCLIYLPL